MIFQMFSESSVERKPAFCVEWKVENEADKDIGSRLGNIIKLLCKLYIFVAEHRHRPKPSPSRSCSVPSQLSLAYILQITNCTYFRLPELESEYNTNLY